MIPRITITKFAEDPDHQPLLFAEHCPALTKQPHTSIETFEHGSLLGGVRCWRSVFRVRCSVFGTRPFTFHASLFAIRAPNTALLNVVGEAMVAMTPRSTFSARRPIPPWAVQRWLTVEPRL